MRKIYGDFFEAHRTNLQRLRLSGGFDWSMLCPGFLRGGDDFPGDGFGLGRGDQRDVGDGGFGGCGGGGRSNCGDNPLWALPALPEGLRTWVDVNDERLGGLSATYGDLAAVAVREVALGLHAGEGRAGKRLGLESPKGYYPSLVPSTLRVAQWQAHRLLRG